MTTDVRKWFDLPRILNNYRRRMPLILLNGLAEQPESWFANRTHLTRHFDVKVPEILVYDGEALHRHIDAGGDVTIDYLADRLACYLDEFVQRPAVSPGRLEPGLPGHPVVRRATSGAGREAGADLPVGIPRRREPAGDRRRPAEQPRGPDQVGVLPRPFRLRRPGAGVPAEVPGPALEDGRPPDLARDGGPFGRPALAPGRAADPGASGAPTIGSSRMSPARSARPRGSPGSARS